MLACIIGNARGDPARALSSRHDEVHVEAGTGEGEEHAASKSNPGSLAEGLTFADQAVVEEHASNPGLLAEGQTVANRAVVQHTSSQSNPGLLAEGQTVANRGVV